MIEDLRPYQSYRDSGLPWAGEIPTHWQLRRLKTLASMASGEGITRQTIEASGEYPVFGGNGIRGYTSAFTHDGDFILIGRQGARCGNVHFARGRFWASEHAVVATLFPGYDTRWFGELTRVMDLNQYSVAAAQPGLAVERIQNLWAPVPPPQEQSAIARFIGHADQLIGRCIRAKQKLIRLLEEQKQAIIQRAVTHGIDPNVRLKASGVEWLGNVPEHWEVCRSRRLFSVRTELARPDDVQLSATQAYGVIPQSEFEAKIGRKVTQISMHLEKRRHVEKDDFVISMRSFQGGLERAWASGAIRSSYVVLKPGPQVDIGYFAYVFKSRRYIGALQSTADFIRDGQDLTFDNFRRVDLPLMSLEEQRAIASFVAAAVQRVDVNRSRLAREIALLREYRTRLIADVVTGKLDVREAVAGLPDEIDECDDMLSADEEFQGTDEAELPPDELVEEEEVVA